jgi:hypothetical protein
MVAAGRFAVDRLRANAMADIKKLAEKWKRNLTNATDTIKAGVDAMTVNPMAEAAKAVGLMKKRINEAIDSGKVERGLLSADVNDWKKKMKTQGVNRIADGAVAAQSKVEKFLSEFVPLMEQASAEAKKIDKSTTEGALQRVRVVMEAAKKFKKS